MTKTKGKRAVKKAVGVEAQDMLTTPIGFIEGILNLPMYPWQDRAVAPLEFAAGPKGRVTQISVLAPNESGKSSRVVAGAALYWAAVHKRGKVVITTKDGKQLNEQIIPAIEALLPKLENWRSVRSPYYKVTTPTGGRIVAYTTDEAGRAEGFHTGDPIDEPLLIIVDEAKSVAEAIFDAIDRCGFRALMYCSSGGVMQGTFFKSQTEKASQFHQVKVGLIDCPHISQEKVDRFIAKHGEHDPLTRSSIYGEFMVQTDADEFIFPHTSLDACIKSPPKHKPGLKLGFCDFGEGVAEHTFTQRDGNKAWIQKAWRQRDKHAAASQFVYEFRKSGLTEGQIWGDAADAEMLRLIRDLGWNIRGQNFGHAANNDEEYMSWGAEAWHETALMVLKQEIIVPDDDPVLYEQLASRKRTLEGRGKKGAEKKYVMKERGIESPDRGDGYCAIFNIHDVAQAYKTPFRIPAEGIFSEHEASEQREVLEGVGAFAGV